MELQKKFVQSVRLYFKEEGEAWLKKLPDLFRYCEEKWALKMGEPYTLSVNYVAPAITENGEEVVIKISIPGEGFLDELEALQLFEDKGIVRLIDSDKENGVILLEKLSPGQTLAELDDHEEASRIAARVIGYLTTPAPINTRIPSTKVREESLRRIVRDYPDGLGPISQEVLRCALKVFVHMNETMENRVLLHGDFHHYNVLSSGDGRWTAIDPKGLIGEVEYDLIQYLLNRQPDEGADEVIKRRVEIFTEELDLDEERLLLWGYCHTVLATAWSVDASDGTYSKSFFGGIAIFEKLYEAFSGETIRSRFE